MSQKKVLVVEDERMLRQMLEKHLEKEGLVTLAAGDGKEGLAVALEHKPDLILLDIMMPHSGLEMLVELRKDPVYGKRAPVIFLSNLSPDTEEIMKVIEEQEPVFYFVKANSTIGQITDKVREVLA